MTHTMEVIQVLHMNKGEGDTSYAKNSVVQRKIISAANTQVEKAVADILCYKFPESMGIADLGCSSGPNTLMVISEVIDAICETSRKLGRTPPELRVSLNDLPGNDFNDIFVSLPAFYKNLKKDKGVNYGLESCFVSGVPGSFYGRLFPKGSLHFVHSSSSLHWLSQVPSSLQMDGTHLNRGKIYISKTSPSSVVNAYLTQFKEDFSLFLKSRSVEMVEGGRMVLSFMGKSSSDPSSEEACYQWELLAQALATMVPEGSVEEEKIDSLNAPYYAPSMEEVKGVIKEDGCFVINSLEAFEIDWDGGGVANTDGDGGGGGGEAAEDDEFKKVSRGERVAKTIRAVVESMLESQFGGDIMDELFRRYSVLVDDHLSRIRAHYINLVVSLTRI